MKIMGIVNLNLKKIAGFWTCIENESYHIDLSIRDSSRSFYDEILNNKRKEKKSYIEKIVLDEASNLPILYFNQGFQLRIFYFNKERNEMILLYPDGTKRLFKRIISFKNTPPTGASLV